MNKVIHPYDIDGHPVFCKIKYNNGNLSISGVEGPRYDGNAWGSCGQIVMSFKEFNKRGHMTINDVSPANGMGKQDIKMFLEIWDKWHLNNMNSACRHQKELGWAYESHHGMFVPAKNPKRQEEYSEYITILETSPDNTVIEGEYGAKFTLKNGELFTWDEYHGHECPECGYSIGSSWLYEEVPSWVIEFLNSLPKTDTTPAWV